MFAFWSACQILSLLTQMSFLHFNMSVQTYYIFPKITRMYVGSVNVLSAGSQEAITAVICSLGFLTLGLILGILWHYKPMATCTALKSRSSSSIPPTASAPVVYEELSLEVHSERKSDIELEENVVYGPI